MEMLDNLIYLELLKILYALGLADEVPSRDLVEVAIEFGHQIGITEVEMAILENIEYREIGNGALH